MGSGPRRRVEAHREPELIPDAAIRVPRDDQLSLEAVVDTVAGLVAKVETPATIAVFGAWGSGKTSLGRLLDQRYEDSKTIRFVYFNAWKYAETPLRRHFLSSAGRSLGEPIAYIRSLYASTQTVDYRLETRTLGALLGIAFLALVGALVLLMLTVLVAFVATGGDYWALLGKSLGENIGELLVSTAVLAPVLTFVVNQMKVQTDTSAPSSAEQFDSEFVKLVKRHLPSNGRLVFFIDELDRAPARQVASVLETIKTFLDQRGCVFVVAADGVVLERAISKDEDITVPDHGNPYYSGGAAYLDKVFQYQIHLPAFEGSALTKFARDLVAKRDGLWQAAGEDLDVVVSLLIPSHVRSPRRVKILLNSLALAARVLRTRLNRELQAREIRELAKLVCLRTEFPLFYRDVETYPALVDAVTAHVLEDTPRIAELDVSPVLSKLARAYVEGTLPVEIRLGGDSQATGEQERLSADQLLEYLRRTRGVPIQDTSLIFMRPPGMQVGLDSTLARVLDDAARNDDTEAALRGTAGATSATIEGAIRYLILAVDNAIGVEIANTVDVLLALADQHSDKLSVARLADVADAIERPEIWSQLMPKSTPALVTLWSRTQPEHRERRERRLVDLTSESEQWYERLMASAPNLSPGGAAQCQALIARDIVAGNGRVSLCSTLEPDAIAALWLGDSLRALASSLSAATGPAGAVAVQASTDLVARLAPARRWDLIRVALRQADVGRLEELRTVLQKVAPSTDLVDINAALDAMARAPTEVGGLSRLLPEEDAAADPVLLANVIAKLLDRVAAEGVKALEGVDLARFGGVLRATTIQSAGIVAEMAAPWSDEWSTPAASTPRIQQLQVVRRLIKEAPARAKDLGELVTASIDSLLAATPVSDDARKEAETWLRAWDGSKPSQPSLHAVFAKLSVPRSPSAGDTLTEARRRYWLFLVARLLDSLTPDEVTALRTERPSKSPARTTDAICAAIYVAVVRPSAIGELEPVVDAAVLADDGVSNVYSEPYFTAMREPEILRVLEGTFARVYEAPTNLVSWLKPRGDQVAWARKFASLLSSGSTRERRKEVWRFLASLRLEEGRARGIALAAALDSMLDSSGSANDLLLELPGAFPGWQPDRATLRRLNEARRKFSGNRWRKGALKVLEELGGRAP